MIAIVGGGIAGVCVLSALVRAGLEAELYDEGDGASSGASAVPVALLNPYRGKRAVPLREDLAGLERFLARVGELGSERAGWRQVGVLRLADTAERAAAWRALPELRWIEAEELASVAGLPCSAPHGGFLFERGGYVDTHALRRALLDEARARGAAVHAGARVLSLVPEGERVRVLTNRGEHSARVVVSCIGAQDAPWAHGADLRRVAGEMLGFDRAALDAARAPREPVIIAGCLLIRAPESIYVGGAHGGETAEPLDARQLLHAAGAALWPALGSAVPSTWFRATRAATPSNQPRIRRVAEHLWSVEGLAGRGYLRAFDLAEQLARELSGAVARRGMEPA